MIIGIGLRSLCLLPLTLGLVRASAAEYFVSTQGNDSNPGTAAQPLRTITRAYSLASAGTTITVLPGVYTDYQTGWGLHLNKAGTASSPIVLRSQIRGQAIIDGENVTDRNQGIRGFIWTAVTTSLTGFKSAEGLTTAWRCVLLGIVRRNMVGVFEQEATEITEDDSRLVGATLSDRILKVRPLAPSQL